MKTKILIPLLLLLTVGAAAQTSKKEIYKDINRSGSTYFAYPGPRQQTLTPAPAGYKPFYISHYGRHGSRYMTSNRYYDYAVPKLDTAAMLGILKPKGLEVLEKLHVAFDDAQNRAGDLTALGGRQHREIAHRMYDRFPEYLSQPLYVDARSSVVGRCIISMFNFCQELQGLNPELIIHMDASRGDMPFVVANESIELETAPQTANYKERVTRIREKAHTSKRLMKLLFTDVAKAEEFIDCQRLMRCLNHVAHDMQSLPELNIYLLDIFTKEELFNMFTADNAGWLVSTGLVPGSTPTYLQQKEVRDSIASFADRVIASGEPTLSLRFSHDSSVLPLAYLMGLREAMGATPDIENLYKRISTDKIIPMAANIQLIFYRKDGSDDILVKFLLNENETSIPVGTDVAPYYHWKDVKRYWESR